MNNNTIIDLTHEIHSTIPTWDLTSGFTIKTMRDYHQCTTEVKFRSQSFELRASAGTHLDAPSHCFEGRSDISSIPLQQLIAPCVLIDVSMHMKQDYKVSLLDIEKFEDKHGQVPVDAFVIFYTGWSKFWHEPKKYHNNLQFPSVSKEVAYLLIEKNVIGIGIDTLSPDCDEKNFSVHSMMLSANKYIVENIAHADQLPPVGSTIFIIPLKIKDAAECPVRLFAQLP